MEFLINILASMVAGVIMLVATTFASTRARWLLTATFGKLLGVDVERVYPNKHGALSDVEREILRSHQVDIMTGRGNDLEAAHFQSLLSKRAASNNTRLRILLPETRHLVSDVNWNEVNDREIALIDRSYGGGLLAKQVESVVEFLKPYLQEGKVEMRRFNMPHLGRILITDRYVFVTFYPHHTRAEYAEVVKFARKGVLSDGFVRLFNLAWDNQKAA